MKKSFLSIILSAFFVMGCSTSQGAEKAQMLHDPDDPYDNLDLAALMDGLDGTFVLYDLRRDRYVRFNEERAKTRFSPCSTFKFPNTLIALETKVADGANTQLFWDAKKYPKEPWWDEVLKPSGKDWARDHTLKTAFAQSVVWAYRELAKKIGDEKMKSHLARFDYGNMDISSGLDGFWLGGSLKISANEQIVFLKKLREGALGLSEETMIEARQIFEVARGNDYVLFAKTGSGDTSKGTGVGWYVGWVEKGDDTYFFALNMTGTSEQIRNRRVSTVRKILAAAGIIPLPTNTDAGLEGTSVF
jgi:beta-lactamase class D